MKIELYPADDSLDLMTIELSVNSIVLCLICYERSVLTVREQVEKKEEGERERNIVVRERERERVCAIVLFKFDSRMMNLWTARNFLLSFEEVSC